MGGNEAGGREADAVASAAREEVTWLPRAGGMQAML